jgi:hypothetical protein
VGGVASRLSGGCRLHLHRYDSLHEAGRLADAYATLRRVVPIAEGNVYLLARLVEVECEEKNLSGALNHALSVCFRRPEESPWPVNRVWEHMRTSGLMREFAEKFEVRSREGAQPTRRALVLYGEQILDQKDQIQVPKWMRKTWLNYVARRIKRLVRLVEESSWVEDGYLADLLAVLNRNSYQRLVLACWGRMRLKGFEANTDAWAQAGSAMINLKRKRAARKLFGDWRTRTGVGMWMLGNYLLSLSRLTRDDLREVIATVTRGSPDCRTTTAPAI